MKEKTDLRIVKTKNTLFNSLIVLMAEKSFDEIKVSDICNKSLINRSTFYTHYNDKYDLLFDYINTLKANLLKSLENNKHIVNTKEFYVEMIRLSIEHIDNERNIYYSVLMSNKDTIITEMLLDVTIKDINKRIEYDNLNKNNIPTEIFVSFYLGAVISVIISWLKSNGKYSKEEICSYINELIPDNMGK